MSDAKSCSRVARRSVSPITCSGRTRVPNSRLATRRDLLSLRLVRPGTGERRRRSDALQRAGVAGLPDTTAEERDVGALPATVGVQLVEHEEAESAGRVDEVALGRPRQQQLEHHVVRQQHVGRVGDDRRALLLGLLAGVAAEGHRALAGGIAVDEELLELLRLRVRQRVHRIDDDRLDAAAAGALAQDRVDDRHDVREALARSGAGREDVRRARPAGLDRIGLMTVQPQGGPGVVGPFLAFAEDAAALVVERPAVCSSSIQPPGSKLGFSWIRGSGHSRPSSSSCRTCSRTRASRIVRKLSA